MFVPAFAFSRFGLRTLFDIWWWYLISFGSVPVNCSVSMVSFIIRHAITYCGFSIFFTYCLLRFCYSKKYNENTFYD